MKTILCLTAVIVTQASFSFLLWLLFFIFLASAGAVIKFILQLYIVGHHQSGAIRWKHSALSSAMYCAVMNVFCILFRLVNTEIIPKVCLFKNIPESIFLLNSIMSTCLCVCFLTARPLIHFKLAICTVVYPRRQCSIWSYFTEWLQCCGWRFFQAFTSVDGRWMKGRSTVLWLVISLPVGHCHQRLLTSHLHQFPTPTHIPQCCLLFRRDVCLCLISASQTDSWHFLLLWWNM